MSDEGEGQRYVNVLRPLQKAMAERHTVGDPAEVERRLREIAASEDEQKAGVAKGLLSKNWEKK